MGRKKKEKVGTFDRIGEEVNLEKCPECLEHPDCFAWMEGRCTALNESGGQGCVFYLIGKCSYLWWGKKNARQLAGIKEQTVIN